jgi:hypothetical protein
MAYNGGLRSEIAREKEGKPIEADSSSVVNWRASSAGYNGLKNFEAIVKQRVVRVSRRSPIFGL